MAEKSSPQRVRGIATFWWLAVPSLIVFVLNLAIWSLLFITPAYAEDMSRWLGIDPVVFNTQYVGYGILLCLLFLLLAYFVMGLLRGRIIGEASAAIPVSCFACLIGDPTGYLLFFIYFLIADIAPYVAPDSGRLFLMCYMGVFMGVFNIMFQMLVAVLAAGGGGLIGSRLLHQRAKPGKASHP